MSTVYTAEAEFAFDTETAFQNALEEFDRLGYEDEYTLKDEDDGEYVFKDDYEGEGKYVIVLRYGTYRNLYPVVNEIIELADDFGIVWTTADGIFKAGYHTPEEDESFDLNEWAEERPFADRPEDDFDALVDWQLEVEAAFFGENRDDHLPLQNPVQSV